MRRARVLLLVLGIALTAAFFLSDAGRYLSLDYFKSEQAAIDAYRSEHPLQTAAMFFAIYAAATALPLPGAALLGLAGGAVFGLFWGTLISSFASSLGATLAFLASRFLFRDAVSARYGERLRAVDEGVRRDGAFYLFALRLAPVVPSFAVNLAMGLTPMRAGTFYLVSQIGMLARTVIFVDAGTQIASVNSLGEVVSRTVIASLFLFGIFPLLAKKAVAVFAQRRLSD